MLAAEAVQECVTGLSEELRRSAQAGFLFLVATATTIALDVQGLSRLDSTKDATVTVCVGAGERAYSVVCEAHRQPAQGSQERVPPRRV